MHELSLYLQMKITIALELRLLALEHKQNLFRQRHVQIWQL